MTVEDCMTLMILKFEDYARRHGADKNTLNINQLYDLGTTEFPTICGNAKKEDMLKGIIGKMDANKDKKVTFEEFMCFSSSVAIALRELLK
ncbi:protein S100-A4-like isoform X2 [Aquarana catesbeiana]